MEKEMAAHPGVPAWRVPWPEPGGLLSIGWHRVRHDRSHLAAVGRCLAQSGNSRSVPYIHVYLDGC